MHLETWESDKGILEPFGGYSSLLKKDMHIGECPTYSVQWKKPGRKSKRNGVQCPGISVCLHLEGMYAEKPESQYNETTNIFFLFFFLP